MTRDELLAAYAEGERDFAGANLRWANLSGANLSGADLRWANLSGANLREANVFVVYGLTWPVWILPGRMGIGCETHSPAEWRAFDDDAIAAMHSDALGFWRERGPWLLAECDRIDAEYAERADNRAQAEKGETNDDRAA